MVGQGTVLPIPIRRRKLMPPRLTGTLVDRPRLMDHLGRSLDLPLTLVVAPAGYGKTTLMRQWQVRQAQPAVWLTIDHDDTAGRRLVSHLVAALQPALDLDHIGAITSGAMSEIGGAIADALFDLDDELIIILDDAHEAIGRDLLDFLTSMVRLMPPSVHLIILSRLDTPVSLARMRARDQLLELRAADLRFTREETAALLHLMAPDRAPPETIDLLHEHTDGWITGLRLAIDALPLTRDRDELLRAASGHRHLMQYLVEEILANERPEDQDFLLRTSVVDRITGSLAAALLDGSHPIESQAHLERLGHDRLVLEATEEPGWFRYHTLFRQLLNARLASRSGSEVVRELHQRAGTWFAGEGQVADALAHFVTADDAEAAASLIEERMHEVLAREDWRTVAAWLQQLPEDLIRSRPELLLARGLIAHLSGRAAPLRLLISEVKVLARASGADAATEAAIQAEADILSLGTLLPVEQNPRQAAEIIAGAVEHLPRNHRFVRGLALGMQGIVLQALGREHEAITYLEEAAAAQAEHFDAASIRALLGLIFVHRQTGAMNALADTCRHTLTIATREDLAVTGAWASLFLGWIAYERDDLPTAHTHFSAVIVDERRAHLSCVREAYFGRALVYQAQGITAAANQDVARIQDIIVDARALEHLPYVYGFEARLALMRDELEPARQWAASSEVSIDGNTLFAIDSAFLTRVRVMLAVGTPEFLVEALHHLAIVRERAASAHHEARLVEIWALAALVHQAQGHEDQALAALHASLGHAARGVFVRTYLDLGPAMLTLLHRAQAQIDLPPRLQQAITAAATHSSPDVEQRASSHAVLGTLSMRERDVLELLAKRHSYQEIADQLFISAGTVKRHVSSIYGKLDVGNRREALIKAESLGWTLSG